MSRVFSNLFVTLLIILSNLGSLQYPSLFFKMSNDPYYNKLQPNSYVILLRISAGLSTSAFLIGAYLILTKTPRRFGDYKWFIFNILVAAYAFDIYTR